jgi:hypothetical protein
MPASENCQLRSGANLLRDLTLDAFIKQGRMKRKTKHHADVVDFLASDRLDGGQYGFKRFG